MFAIKIALCLIAAGATGAASFVSLTSDKPAPDTAAQPASSLPSDYHRPALDVDRLGATFRH